LSIALTKAANRWRWPSLVEIDQDLAILVADPGEEYQKRNEEIQQLGRRWATESPSAVFSRLAEWRDAASRAEISTDWAISIALTGTAQEVERPTLWAEEAVERGLVACSAALLEASVRTDPTGARGWLERAISITVSRQIALLVALHPTANEEIRRWALGELTEADAAIVETVMLRLQTADFVAWGLLTHTDRKFRIAAALCFSMPGETYWVTLPSEWEGEWRAGLLDARPEDLTSMLRSRLEELLKSLAIRGPDLVELWVCRRIEEKANEQSLELFGVRRGFAVAAPARADQGTPRPGRRTRVVD
jgi:hypothetical protein